MYAAIRDKSSQWNIHSLKPIVNPVGLLLLKVDDGTGKGYPQGAATLKGAEFTVKYYDGYYSSQEEAEKGGAAKKTWVFKTDGKGEVYLDKEGYKVSGDELYINNGKVVFPLGTVTIQETKALDGYLLDNTVHMIHQMEKRKSCSHIKHQHQEKR